MSKIIEVFEEFSKNYPNPLDDCLISLNERSKSNIDKLISQTILKIENKLEIKMGNFLVNNISFRLFLYFKSKNSYGFNFIAEHLLILFSNQNKNNLESVYSNDDLKLLELLQKNHKKMREDFKVFHGEDCFIKYNQEVDSEYFTLSKQLDPKLKRVS